MSHQDPFYQHFYNTGASTVQPQPAQQVSLVSQLNEQSLQAIREIVREEVQKAMVEMVNKMKAQTGAKF